MTAKNNATAEIRRRMNEALDAIDNGAKNYHIFFGIQQVVGESEESLRIAGDMGMLGNPEIVASGIAKLALNEDLRPRALQEIMEAMMSGNFSEEKTVLREEINELLH